MFTKYQEQLLVRLLDKEFHRVHINIMVDVETSRNIIEIYSKLGYHKKAKELLNDLK